jgi:hypothetical protein
MGHPLGTRYPMGGGCGGIWDPRWVIGMGGGVFCLCGCGYEEVIPDGYVPVAIPKREEGGPAAAGAGPVPPTPNPRGGAPEAGLVGWRPGRSGSNEGAWRFGQGGVRLARRLLALVVVCVTSKQSGASGSAPAAVACAVLVWSCSVGRAWPHALTDPAARTYPVDDGEFASRVPCHYCCGCSIRASHASGATYTCLAARGINGLGHEFN